MNVWIATSMAYALPRGLIYAYGHLPINQNWEQEDNPHFISVIAQRMVNCLVTVNIYLPYAARVFLNFLLASIYDSSWMAIPLFSVLVAPCGGLMGIAAILGLSIFIEIARNWVEFLWRSAELPILPPLLCTHYPVDNILAHIAFKVIMLFPALFLIWLFPYMAGRMIFLGEYIETDLLRAWTILTVVAAMITYPLLQDLYNHLSLSVMYLISAAQFLEEVDPETLGPEERLCPILQDSMRVPVRIHRCGHIFEKDRLIEWMMRPGQQHRSCPLCRQAIISIPGNRLINWIFQ